MIGLDTNVLVRYLTRDDEAQWKQAVKIINNAESCFISDIVLCEMVWVLRGRSYKYLQPKILSVIELLLQSSKLEFTNRTVIYQALRLNKLGQADFADYLIGAINYNHECTITVTFDQKLKGEKWYRVLD
ncbi:PIN domain-containing protein [Pleurocapsa sp. FMAR1]|uniref:PIN domain-containing protein n=1 Tax=Pleurocapsa sp. FMAR1 TaxID=3040204 RepID=UPI0029C98E87|nr:type II toxin-antitoxin system VapC family toxin [Pleurocapsa sp. FMAR1]